MKITDLLTEHGVAYAQHAEHQNVREGWIGIDCPECSPGSGKFLCGIPLNGRTCFCWQCGRLSLIDVLSTTTNLTAREIKRLIGDLDPEQGKPQAAVGGKLVLPHGLMPLNRRQSSYLRARGLDPVKNSQLWGLQGLGLEAGKLAWRIFIPCFYQGRMVSYTTRSISSNTDRRYMSCPRSHEAISIKTLLLGEDMVKSTIIVCEGAFDAMSIGPGAVATCGLGYTQEQMIQMAKYPRRIICFDNEKNAQRRARALVEELGCFDGETINVQLSGKDANDTLLRFPKELRRLRRKFFR